MELLPDNAGDNYRVGQGVQIYPSGWGASGVFVWAASGKGGRNRAGNISEQRRILPLCDRKLSEYAAVFFNIRNFKFINQTVGVKTGDVILKEFAFYINSNLKEEEYISRLGGDNFFALVKKEQMHVLKLITFTYLCQKYGTISRANETPHA